MKLTLESRSGRTRELHVGRWHEPATRDELALLSGLRAPALDVGCGPGRIVHALACMGVPAMGIDVAPEAVRRATDLGAVALCRSVFDPVPGEGRWASVLLLDGNVGIGGDPVALLTRCAQIGRSGATLVVELDPPEVPSTVTQARIVTPGEEPGPWFPWATVSSRDVAELAAASGTEVLDLEHCGGRCFVRLRVCPGRVPSLEDMPREPMVARSSP